MKRIGERVKRKRELLNMQLNDLAKKVGISSSALSQIEKAKAFPSIVTLKAIADNLHTTVGELVGENESLSQNPVVRENEIKFIEKNTGGTEVYLLSHHDLNKQMDTYLIHFVKSSSLEGLFTNLFGQVFGYVLSGKISFELDGKKSILENGDSFYFNLKMPFSIKNYSVQSSKILWIISPPNF
ncbi:MAG: helix-turn-helix transcriptional regulator [Bacteroidales bacterium]|nr:helix-turn-helix transcriptional regulator [Bacteroidales bacterium]